MMTTAIYGKRFLTSLTCFIALVACLLAFPAQAHATFKDTATTYPASQDLGTYDEPIYGNQLPDGAYLVTARTTSNMCILYTDPNNAEARDSKEQAIILVEGGSITAVFYISKAYTYLYMGTQEEAASLTNADGTDSSAYIAGDPSEGYVPHLFYLSIPALNVPMTIAAYTGGRGQADGVWYTRQVVFGMTQAELQQIIAEAENPESEKQSEQSGSGSSDSTSQQALGTENETANTSTQDNNADTAPEETETTQVVATASATKAVRMNITSPDAMPDVTVVPQLEAEEPEDTGLSPQQLFVLALVVTLGVGALARGLAFSRSYQPPTKK